MEVVELTEADCEAAIALWDETGLTRPWNDPIADFLRAINGKSSAVLGIRGDDGDLLSTAMIGDDGHRGWVYYVAVSPSAQGTGLGRTTMESCEAWLIARGVPKIQFMVRTGHEQVLSFYERLGYQRQETEVLGRRLDSSYA